MAARIAGKRLLQLTAVRRPNAVISSINGWNCTSSAKQQQLTVPMKTVSTWTRPQYAWRRPGLLLCRNYSEEDGMTLSQLQERVINVLKMFDKIDPDKISFESHFMNDLGLDSLDVVEIVMAFEDEFGVEIDDEQAEKVFTVTNAVELLKTKLDVH